jgi:hypothetical protein
VDHDGRSSPANHSGRSLVGCPGAAEAHALRDRDDGKLATAQRPRYVFSGLTKCGVCGAGFIMGSANRPCCFGARDQETCSNKLTIRRDEVEARVLKALQENLLRQDLFEAAERFSGFGPRGAMLERDRGIVLTPAAGALEACRSSR